MKKNKIRVVIIGAAGRMGQESVRAITAAEDLELVGGIGHKELDSIGADLGEIAGIKPLGIKLSDNLKDCIQRTKADVALDFTIPSAIFNNANICLDCGVRPIIGATGLSNEDLKELEKKANYLSSSILVAPNFTIGAVLMIEAAKKFAKYFDGVEIIELHHDKKVDAPSGTAIKTAKEISKILEKKSKDLNPSAKARGDLVENIRIHSVRLPGILANQEVIFGGQGQSLSIKHDTLDRSAFMPGVLLAIRKIIDKKGLIYGLENLLD